MHEPGPHYVDDYDGSPMPPDSDIQKDVFERIKDGWLYVGNLFIVLCIKFILVCLVFLIIHLIPWPESWRAAYREHLLSIHVPGER